MEVGRYRQVSLYLIIHDIIHALPMVTQFQQLFSNVIFFNLIPLKFAFFSLIPKLFVKLSFKSLNVYISVTIFD